MKNQSSRESVLMILGVAVIAAGFAYFVYFPGQKAAGQTQREIAEAEQAIRDIPLRVAELQSLQHDLQRRRDYLHRMERQVPPAGTLHDVLRQVSQLAKDCSLSITRLEPLTPVPHETYEAVPFRIGLTGEYRNFAAFLHGLENQDRVMVVEELSLSNGEGKGRATIGDVRFVVYAAHGDFADSADFAASPARSPADQ